MWTKRTADTSTRRIVRGDTVSMPRPPRLTVPGLVYHLLSRRVMRMRLFAKTDDYLAFERVLGKGLGRTDAPRCWGGASCPIIGT